jgi:predicted phosphodiesterase
MELGVYLPDGTFRSRDQIILEAHSREVHHSPIFATPVPVQPTLEYFMDRLSRRTKEAMDMRREQRSGTVALPRTSLISFISDIHAGGYSDIERLKDEVNQIEHTPNSYAVLMGDAIDGFLWNPAQAYQVEQVPLQVKFYRALVRRLYQKNKLLAGWLGDHDGWHAKTGLDTTDVFAPDTGIYLFNGLSYLTIKVAQQEYKIAGAHRLPGFSMYNPTHPEYRALHFGGVQGADLIIAGHTHRKGISQTSYQTFGGHSQSVTLVSLGAYKWQDEYADKLGLTPKDRNPADMYGISVILREDQKSIEVHQDILGGHRAFRQYTEP